MRHKKSKHKHTQNYTGYNQHQPASNSAEDDLMSEKYKNNSNAQE